MTTALPIRYKPFCLEHAKAGAPITTREGHAVEILKWDRNSPLPIVGIIKDEASTVMAWNVEGCNNNSRPFTLVMTPLGYIDGKPVFVGDRYIGPDMHTFCTVYSGKTAMPTDREFAFCRWPAPAEVYPESTMNLLDFKDACKGLHVTMKNNADFEAGKTTMELEVWGNDGLNAALRVVANAALRHAVDAGQLVLPGNVVPSDDSVITIGGKNFVSVNSLDKIRAARDLAIAEAVRSVAVGTLDTYVNCNAILKARFVAETIGNLDLAAIIAGVGA